MDTELFFALIGAAFVAASILATVVVVCAVIVGGWS